ncbi:SDR family NAD(P)-dependent oxidoreductase [Maritimibacter fusiformis]|uniref:SDR family oxidoreductase n=1 Tax=Maritimibacter fusiformis TaxID=2603819 RepID=A0A5D0RQC7_9RHOB|nr:SDR family oxidoreductase [Maritimibacter fusiformis]TYB83206.1 SDR family oxidoreductase [Maritimibacter fusiformis]
MTDHPGLRLDGKRALITGGASGIGFAAAKVFAGLGARVVIADIDEGAVRAARPDTGAIAALTGDITSADDCAAMTGAAEAAMGGLDILVNAAGIAQPHIPSEDLDADTWRRVIDVDLNGAFLIAQAAARRMLPRGAGAIVLISSICAQGSFPGRAGYGAAKAGVDHMTASMACEWGPRGLRTNTIAPGYTRTPMVADLIEKKAFDPAVIEARTPLARFAEPDEMARAMAFLASDWASYVNGAVLPVDGGWGAFAAAGAPAG